MMQSKLFKDVSASSVQVLINHVLGTVVLLIISISLPKGDYGEFNWSFAVFTFAYSLLSLRLEQIVVKRSAIEKDSSKIMTLYLMHVLISGVGFYLLLLLLKLLSPSFFTSHNLLMMAGISQLLSFISSPFKQVANGKERFDFLAVMSSVNNLARVILLTIGMIFTSISTERVLIIFIVSSFLEIAACFFIIKTKMKIPFYKQAGLHDYILLLKESLPQIGSAVLMAGITRIDWIFLGFFSTSVIVAEYSFAYRVYELSPFPLFIIAPVLLTRFSKYFAGNDKSSLLHKKKELSLLIRVEMIVATMIPMILNIIWAPLIDFLTSNKYGSSNQDIFLILSFCIPFQYISNIIWSAHFAKNSLSLILKITTVTFLIVLAGDILFIPKYGAKAAALVFLAAMLIEYFNYMRSSELSKVKESWLSPLICIAAAACSGIAGVYFFDSISLRLLLALMLFFLLLVATRQFRKSDIVFVLQLTRNKNK